MQLYRIANGIKNCFKVDENAVINGETGEVFDADYLDQLKMKKEAKVDNIACWIKELEAEAEALKKQEEGFAVRRKRAERRAASLKDYLTFWVGGENLKLKRSEVRWRKSTSVTIMDENAIPETFKKQKITEVVDKAGIKDALKKGNFVDGAVLTEKQNIQIK